MKNFSLSIPIYLFAIILVIAVSSHITALKTDFKKSNPTDIKKHITQAELGKIVIEDINKQIQEKPLKFSDINRIINTYQQTYIVAMPAEPTFFLTDSSTEQISSTPDTIYNQTLAHLGKPTPGYNWAEKEAEVMLKRGSYTTPMGPVGEQCGFGELNDFTVGTCSITACGGAPELCGIAPGDGPCFGQCDTNPVCYYSGFCVPTEHGCMDESCYGRCGASSGNAYIWDQTTQMCCCGT